MKTKNVMWAALGAGLMVVTCAAQTATSAPAAAAAPAVAMTPSKVALIEFEEVVAETNEGQHALKDLQTKFEPKKKDLDAQLAEIDKLKKDLQAAPATTTAAEKSARQKTIDAKERALSQAAAEAEQSYRKEMQDAIGKIAQKMGPVVLDYVKQNGYTLLLNNTGQQAGLSVMWMTPGTDISQAVLEAYNKVSGVAPLEAPAASAPAKPAASK
ncbi:MAG: OmpH family outer membrane protein [Acidobacteriota bacterium]|nr:OmpH family outer membrane protein [Acidobacteriota bacterium]